MKLPEKFKNKKHIQKITLPTKYKSRLPKINQDLLYNADAFQSTISDFQNFRKLKRYTDNELLNIIKSEAIKLRTTPTVNHFSCNPSLPHYQTYYARWGSWQDVLKAAGLSSHNIRTKKRYTDGHLLNLLRLESKRLGRTPTSPHFKNSPDLPSVETYVSRWGSWNNAIRAAGLEINIECPRKKEKKDSFELLMEKPQNRIHLNKLRLEERQQVYWIYLRGLRKIHFLEGDEDRAISEFVEINRERLQNIQSLSRFDDQSKIPKNIDRAILLRKINNRINSMFGRNLFNFDLG